MVKMISRIRWGLALLFVVAFQAHAGIFNEQPKELVEERSYVAVFGTSCDINSSGDFNGYEEILPSSTGPQDQSLVPKVKRDFGGGALVGYRKGLYALEFSYWRSYHITEWYSGGVTFSDKATYESVNLDLKRYLFPRLPAQPFILAGLSFPWLTAKDASNSYPTSTTPSDATYSGLGFNLGVGLEIYLSQQFSVFGGATQRWSGFDKVKGYYRTTESVTMGSNTSYSLHGDGVNFYAGATVSCF